MFISCYGDLMDMLGLLVMNSSGLAAIGHWTVPMQSMLLMYNFLVFINTSANPPEAKIFPNFF
jgi:hypothetical protein